MWQFASEEVIRHGSENHAKYYSYTLGVALFGLGKLKLAFQKWFQKPHKSRDLGELILLDDQFITPPHLVAENGSVKVTRKNEGLPPPTLQFCYNLEYYEDSYFHAYSQK